MKIELIGNNDTTENPHLITPATLVHFMSGVYFAWVIYPLFDKKNDFVRGFIIYNIIHFIYELKDFTISYNSKVSDYLERVTRNRSTLLRWSKENSIYNSIADQLFSATGYIVGYYLLSKIGNNIAITTVLSLMLLATTSVFFITLDWD